ncbi:MAG: hypothetical protein M3498_05860, partial [Deinococcota bacterium]|nr:hypothetical protein [Deinococcota bacterium]
MPPSELLVQDQDIIRRDRQLPGLGRLLDPQAFAEALRVALPGRRVGEARVRYLRYKPGTNCLVAYQLELDGHVTDAYAKAYRLDAADKLRSAIEKGRGHGRLRPQVLDPMIAVYAFPADRKLAALNKVAETEARAHFLGKLLPAQPELHRAHLRPLRYKPERRFVAQLAAGGLRVVLKLYDEYDFERARRGAQAFRDGPVKLAPLLGGSSSKRALVWAWVPGRPLDQVLAE